MFNIIITNNLYIFKGLHLCLGHIVDEALVKLIEQEVSQLSQEVKLLETSHQEEANKIFESLKCVKDSIDKFKGDITKQVESIDQSQDKLNEKMDEISATTSAISEDVRSLQKGQEKLVDDCSRMKGSHEKLTRRVDQVEENHENLDKQVQALKRAIDNKNSMTLNDTFQAPNRIPYFCGRAKELDLLGIPLKNKGPPCVISAICGLGGTGKTSLAIEHVWKNKEIYKSGVFWMSGESVNQFQNTLSEMARQVGTFDDDFKTTLSKTLHWLQTRQHCWCVVIDNLDEYDLQDSVDMMKFLCGHWKRSAAGHIIITTRRDVKQLQCDIPEVSSDNCIELANLTEQESVLFLATKTQITTNSDNIMLMQDLAAQLGYLPLALDQAAAYIKNGGIQLSTYLGEYKKQKLKILKRFKAYYPAQDTSKDRIAVHTTWQLNFDYVQRLSDDYGIGKAASLVMEVSAFLSPDDIPLEIINEGLPQIKHEDLHDCLSSPLGITDIVSVLTKFSLFQRFTDTSLSVHRLVQEVIRSKTSKDDTKRVLKCASRMLHHAFSNTNSPESICKSFQGDSVFVQSDPPSLYLWGKLGAHASVLQSHLFEANRQDESLGQDLIFTEETARLLNEASLYLGSCRQKAKSLELQTAKLEVLNKLETSDENLSSLQYFHFPLKDVEFKLISHCLGHKEKQPLPQTKEQQMTESMQKKADEWREKGNSAYKNHKFHEAIECYSMALKFFNNDHRALCNRALCFLKTNEETKALEDCENCLKIEKHYVKALQRKAWALFELSKKQTWLKGKANAAAAVAVYVDPKSKEDKSFKRMFPNISFSKILNPSQLIGHFLYLVPNQTLLLHKGCFDLEGFMIDENIQLVAIDDQVTMKFEENLKIFDCDIYIEGITFPRGGGSIICDLKSSVTMFKCHISNGLSGCEDFPECNGGTGCKAALYPAREPCNRTGRFGEPTVSGVPGYAGVQVLNSSVGHFENCDFERCGGGGILSHGSGSKVYIKSCKVHGNLQAGLEAREGGCLEAIDNDIYSNGYHGVLIGPSAGSCKIVNNRIYENCREGILVTESPKEEVKILKNQIFHNLPFGISLQQGLVQIKQNDIFENGFYGIHAKILTTATVENNDIYSNKCGGIHMGINFSGRIIFASNKVRDHSGPCLVTQKFNDSICRTEQFQKIAKSDPYFFLPEGESTCYSNPPILRDNEFRNNEEGIFHHPREKIKLVKNECSFCYSTENLLRCSRCNIASYCSISCQENHWEKHRRLCSALSENYFVLVDFNPFHGVRRTFGPHLKGIGKGRKPDPKSKRKFIVKVQTRNLNCHPLQVMTLYDQSTSIDGEIQSPDIFHVIMECGVLGKFAEFTSKKAFFYATFANENGRKLRIDLAELAPYQEW